MEATHAVRRGDIPSTGPGQSRTANYAAAKRAAIAAGRRHCVPLLDVLGSLHVNVAPERAAVHPSQEWLAHQLGCAVSTVRAQLDALVAAGILARDVARPQRKADGSGEYTRRTNRYWLTLRRIWARIRAGRTYRRSTGGMSPLRGAGSLGGPVSGPPPPPKAALPSLFDPPEPWTPPDEAERARVKARNDAIRGRRQGTL